MRTIYVVLLAVSAAVLVGMSALLVTSAAAGHPILFGSQNTGNRGTMMGSSSGGGGMMGSYSGGGMMGGYSGGGLMGGGGMMGGVINSPSATTANNSFYSMMSKMMGGAYGNYSSWCLQYMEKYFGTGSNLSRSGQVLVIIENYAFYPANITVPKGTTVTWINMDFVAHTVTSGSEQSPTNLFDSHELSHMQSFSYTFTSPGTYKYFCDIHPGMVGTLTVT